MFDPTQALNDDTTKTAVETYNTDITKLQGAATTAQASLWGLQKAAEAASKTFAANNPAIINAAAGFEKLQIGAGKLGTVLQKGFEVGQTLKVLEVLKEGAAKVVEQFDRIPQALALMNASGVNTQVLDEFNQLGDALKLNKEAIDQFSINAVARFNEFNAALTRVNTLFSKESGFNAEKYGNDIQKLVNGPLKNAVSSVDALGGAYNAISAGFTKAADSQAVMTAGLKLAKAGAADSSDVLRLLGATLNAYGKSASDAAKVGAQLNLIVQKGITTIPELANGFAETATTAKSAGIKLEDLAASVAVLTTKGNSTPSALTGIEALARNIISKTPEATKALEGLTDAAGKAVKFDITEIKSDGLAKSLQRLNEAVGGNVVKLKEIIPESRAYAAALALMQNKSKDLKDISLQMGQVTAKALDDVFGQQIAQKSEKFVQIVNRFGEVMIKLGQSLAPAFESGIKVLDGISEAIAKIPDGIKENIAQFLLAGLAFKQTTGALTIFASTLAKAFVTYQTFRLTNMAFNGELFKQIEIVGKLSKANAGLIPIALQLLGFDQQRILVEKDLLVGAEQEILTSRNRFAAAKELATEKKDLAGALKTLLGLDKEALVVSKRVAQSYDEQVAAIQPLINANKAVKKSREEVSSTTEQYSKAQEQLALKQTQFAKLEEELAKKRTAQKLAEQEADKLLPDKTVTTDIKKQVVEKVETAKTDVAKSETERLIRLKDIQKQEELVNKTKAKAEEAATKESETISRVTANQLELITARRKASELEQAAKEAETLAEIANTQAKAANQLASEAGLKDVALNTAAEEANTLAKTQNAVASKARTAAQEADIAVRKLNTELLKTEAIAENKLIETRFLGMKTTLGNNSISKLLTTNISDAFKGLADTVSKTLGFSTEKLGDFFGFLSKRSKGGFFKELKDDFVNNFKTIKSTIENPVDSFKKLKDTAVNSFSAISKSTKILDKDSGLFSGILSTANGFFNTIKSRSADAGKALTSVATGLTSGMGNAIKALQGFEFSFAGLQAAMSGGVAAITGLLTTGLSGALAAVGTGFTALTGIAATAWTAITGPLAPLVVALGAVAAGVALLYDKFFGLGKAADDANKEINKIGEESKQSIADVDKAFKDTSDAIDQNLITSFKDLGEQAPKELLGVREAIKPIANDVEVQKGALATLWDMIVNGIKNPIKSIKDFVLNITGLNVVAKTIGSSTNIISDNIAKLTNWLKNIPVIGDIIKGVEAVGNKINNVFKGIGDAIGGIGKAYKLDQIVEPVNKLQRAGADLATDQLRASAAIGAYNKGLFQSAQLNDLVLKGTKLTAEQQAIKQSLMDKEAASMQRLVDRANAETEANNKRIEEAQKLADKYKKVTKDASGNEVEDLKNQDVRRTKLLQEIETLNTKNEKLKQSVASAKEELDLVIKLQQERERLQERVRKNTGADLDPTKGDKAGENAVQNALNRGLQASTDELDTYSKKVQAVLDGTGKYVETTTDKTGKKVSRVAKLALTDMEGATDKLDEKVQASVAATDALFEQGYIDSDKAAEQVTATLEKTITGVSGKQQKLKELLEPQTQIDLINKVLEYQQKASQNMISLKTKEVEKLKALDNARLGNSAEIAKKIRDNEVEQIEIQRQSLEKQITALTSSKQASPQKLKELTADLDKLKIEQKAKTISNAVEDANQQNNIVKEQLDKELDLQKTYQESKIGNVEAATKKIQQIEEKQLEIQRSSLVNEIKVLQDNAADPKRIADLQNNLAKLDVQQKAKRMTDKIDDSNEEVEKKKEKIGQQLELEKLYQQARLKDAVETTKKIGELELQQLQQSKVALQNKLKIMKESGADPQEIKKIEDQITNIQVQESAKRITNIQAEMSARVTQLKQTTDKTLAVEELARLKGERSYKESTEKTYQLRQQSNIKEQQLIVEQINRTKAAGGNTDDLQKQLIDKQIDYQRLLTEKIQKEVERRKAILTNSVNDQIQQQTKLLDSLDAQQKSLESETKLQDSRKQLLAAQNDYAVGMLQNQLKITGDIEKRATIERQIAERNEKNLLQQQQAELDNLKVQEQQNKLAEEKEQIQLRVSQLQNKLSQDQLKLDIESAKRTKSKSDEEITAMQQQLSTLQEQGTVLNNQQQFITKNAAAQAEITKNNRLQLEYKQRLARENAHIDVELAKNKEILAVYEKQAQSAKIRADITATIADVELKRQEAIGKAYETRTKLLTQQKNIIDESLASAQSNYQIAADLTTDEKQKAQIQKEALTVRMTTLSQQQKIERELFEIQLKQNKLAIERQKIEAQIAVIRKEAELAAAVADDKRIQADKTKSKEEKEASRASLEAKKVDVAAAQYQQDLVKQQEKLSEQSDQTERQKLNSKQQQDSLQLRVEYAKSTTDKNDDIAVRNEALATARNTVNNIAPQTKALAGLNTELPKFEDYIKRLNVGLPKLSDVTQEAVNSTVKQNKTINNNSTNNQSTKEGDLTVDAPINIKIERDADKDLANEVGTEIYDNLYNVIHKVRQRM